MAFVKHFLMAFLLVSVLRQDAPTVSISSFTADLSKTGIRLFWKDVNGNRFGSIENLKKHLESNGQKALCLMNAGMFRKDFSPQGLYVENAKTIVPLDVSDASGNFYLKPNGVFYISKNGKAHIAPTQGFEMDKNVAFATQSGPMLLIDGKIHVAFKQGSANLNIRNGVGILPDGKVLFAISDAKINFYDFALFFKNAGCDNALYLDGFVSRAWIASQKRQDRDGNFGPMIAVISKKNTKR